MEDEQVLHGGVANAGGVVRVGDHVLRPSNPHSTSIHRMLRSLADAGFTGASVPVGIDPDGRERLVFLRLVCDEYGLDALGRAAFIEMWESMGGQERYDRRRRWWAEARVDFEAALR